MYRKVMIADIEDSKVHELFGANLTFTHRPPMLWLSDLLAAAAVEDSTANVLVS